jgi:hypothetical protein
MTFIQDRTFHNHYRNMVFLPIAVLAQERSQLLKVLLIFVVKAGGLGAIDVNNSDSLRKHKSAP